MTNQELIERILQHDDKEAYKVFFDRMYGRLINFSIYYVKSFEIAQDVVSDVFVNFLRTKNNFKIIDNVESFFYTAVKNQSHKYLRKKKASDVLFTRASSEDYKIKSNERPDIDLINKELHEVLLNAMEKLPPQRKLIFELVKFDGLKYKEVAKTMDISQKTVEKHMSISLKIIREIVIDYLKDEGQNTRVLKKSLWMLSL